MLFDMFVMMVWLLLIIAFSIMCWSVVQIARVTAWGATLIDCRRDGHGKLCYIIRHVGEYESGVTFDFMAHGRLRLCVKAWNEARHEGIVVDTRTSL